MSKLDDIFYHYVPPSTAEFFGNNNRETKYKKEVIELIYEIIGENDPRDDKPSSHDMDNFYRNKLRDELRQKVSEL